MNFISKLCTSATKTMEFSVIIVLEHLANRNSNFAAHKHQISGFTISGFTNSGGATRYRIITKLHAI